MLRLGKVEISSSFLLVSAALLYLDRHGILPWALLACAIHEGGHCLAVKLLGGEIVCLRVTAVGGELRLSYRHVLSYGRELAAALAGPAANFIAVFLAVKLPKASWEIAWLFAGLNLAIGCFNLLPAYPLDGGRAIRLMIAMLWSAEAAEGAARVLSYLTALVLMAAGTVLLWKTGYNFTLLLTAAWILMSTLHARKHA